MSVDNVILSIVEELREIIKNDNDKEKYTKLVRIIGYNSVSDFLNDEIQEN
jgi:hypothetical protein